MFCEECGAKNDEDAVFCVACGKKISDSRITENTAANQAKPKFTLDFKNRKTAVIAVAAAIVLLFVFIILISGKKDYEKVAIQFAEAVYASDGEAMLELFPPELVDELIDEVGSERKAAQLLEETVNMQHREMRNISYKVLNTEDISSEELAEIEDDKMFRGIVISDGKYVEIQITGKEDGSKMRGTVGIYVIEIKNHWYIIAANPITN